MFIFGFIVFVLGLGVFVGGWLGGFVLFSLLWFVLFGLVLGF